MGRGNFEGVNGRAIVKYRETLHSSVQKWLNDRDAIWVVGLDGP